MQVQNMKVYVTDEEQVSMKKKKILIFSRQQIMSLICKQDKTLMQVSLKSMFVMRNKFP